MFPHIEPSTAQFVVSFIVSTVFAFICAYYAEKKGRYPLGWFILGFLFTIFSLIVLFFLSPLKQEEAGSSTAVVKDELKGPPPAPIEFTKEEDRLWYYLDQNHQQMGPVSMVALREEWNRGLLELNSYVWADGMEKWEKVDQLPELKAAFKRER